MLIGVRHLTRYGYDAPVSYAIQSVRLTPAPFTGQRVADWRVRVAGCERPLQFADGFGNAVHLAAINAPHQAVVIEAGGTAETEDCSGIVSGLADAIPPRVYLRVTAQTRPDAGIRELARSVDRKDRLDRLHALAGAGARASNTCQAPRTPIPRPPRRWPTAGACAKTMRIFLLPQRAASACRRAM